MASLDDEEAAALVETAHDLDMDLEDLVGLEHEILAQDRQGAGRAGRAQVVRLALEWRASTTRRPPPWSRPPTTSTWTCWSRSTTRPNSPGRFPSALADEDAVLRRAGGEADRGVEGDLEGAQVPVVDPDHPGAEGNRLADEAGIRALLVGESLMREADVTAATRRLLSGKV
jgi:hypothetical protein